MGDDRHERIRSLFDELVDLPPDERDRVLDEKCAGDTELRREVEELLRHDSSTEQIPVKPVMERMRGWETPERIGRYRILGPLGEGGFGDVYEAEQSEPFRRRVALKIVKAGMDTRALLARFDAERQALALMSHAGIAKVHDAGQTEGGRSYFVMELVRGEAITAYCDRHELPLRERLGLFLLVCDAVRHAHQRGIIHRDLKPSNIMVAEEGGKRQPKVIDFGIAKATGDALGGGTLLTEQGQLVGTPEYMSPEQAETGGFDIDVRTDVYSLGIVLHELLTGATPFDSKKLRSSSIAEIQRTIREEEPKRPSTRVRGGGAAAAAKRATNPARLARQIRGDLDWIVLKTLEKDRERRYDSVAALAADVNRHLNDEPVEAGAPGVAYRMRKFARRYRVPLAVGAIVLASISYALFESNRQRVVAERARDEAEEVTDFLEEMLGAANPRGGEKDVSVRQILDEGSKSIDGKFADRPLVKARLMQTMGMVYMQLGYHDEGGPLIEQALAIREEHLGDDSPDLAYTLNSCGMYRREIGDYRGAVPYYDRAIEVWTRAQGPEAPNVAQALNNKANSYWALGEYDKARPIMEKALAIRKKVRGPDHPDVAQTLNNLGALCAMTGDIETAIAHYERALAIREKALGPDHPDVAQTLQNLGATLLEADDYDRAMPLLERALAIQEKSLGPDHPEVALTLGNLGGLAAMLGDFDKAEEYLARAAEIQESQLGKEHPDLAWSLMMIGKVHLERGEGGEAKPILERAVAIYGKSGMHDHPEAVEAREALAACE